MMSLEDIEKKSIEIDRYLSKLDEFTTSLKEIKQELQDQKRLYELNILKEIHQLRSQINSFQNNVSSSYEKTYSEITQIIESKDFPEAIDQNAICKTNIEKNIRASNIIEIFINENLKNKRFLDFGCGEGLTINSAIENGASFALGFDAKKQWKDDSGLTTSFDVVKENGPYDVILLYDVLDHIVITDPVTTLKNLGELLTTNGKIYIKNHPWSSRHGGHLYLNENKAFIHLLLDEVELMRYKGLNAEHNIKIVTPIETYQHWFKQSKLKVVSELKTTTPVEQIFLKPSCINDKLLGVFGSNENIIKNMQIDFVEYIVEKEPSDGSMI